MADGLKSRSAGRVLYLYGITPEGEGRLAAIPGVDGSATVAAMPCAGLVCWISRVDQTEFAERLASNMEKLEWLAEVSVRHQHVVAAIAQSHDILPARFGTVFHSAASLTADVGKRKAALARNLKRISGCEEWGVKVFRLPAQPPAAAGAKSGRDSLRAKAAALRAEPARNSDPEVRRFIEAVDGLAVATAPGSGAVSRGQRGLQWQASLLVKRSQRAQLQRLMARFSGEWNEERRIELSGPWPPYSFVSSARNTRAERA